MFFTYVTVTKSKKSTIIGHIYVVSTNVGSNWSWITNWKFFWKFQDFLRGTRMTSKKRKVTFDQPFEKKSKLIRPKLWNLLIRKHWKNCQMCLPLLVPELKAPSTGSELKNCPSAEKSGGIKINPPMVKYQNWKKIFPEKRQNFWPSCFLGGQNAGSFIQQQKYFVRWNFQVCTPKPFQQLFTIFGVKAGRKLPLIFAVIKRKRTGDYRRLFKIWKEKILNLTGKPDWNPEFLLSDFEGGIRSAVESEFRETQHWGCYSHFTQSV